MGYNKVGNKALREKHIKHVRDVHLERLRKIKHRLVSFRIRTHRSYNFTMISLLS